MSLTPTARSVADLADLADVAGVGAPPRRVRHQARDVVLVMGFSATASVAVAMGFLLLAHLGTAGR